MTAVAYTIPEFITHFKVGRTTTYQEIANGRLATYTVGRRRYISARAAETWQQRLEDEAKLAKEGAGVPA